ncbi:MAG: VanZ family protein [Prevotella sp.]|nr:VanZ family protein [Prevotella sp.]
MNYLLHLVKKYPFSCLCILVVWIICLIPVPEHPLKHIAFIDKWTHIAMYAVVCALIWTEYYKNHRKTNQQTRPEISLKKLLWWGWLAPILMSGLIEIVQENCTGGNRSGDWLDFAANSTGATLTLCAGMLWVWFRARG